MAFVPPGWFFGHGGSYLALATGAARQSVRVNAAGNAYELFDTYSRTEADAAFAAIGDVSGKAALVGGNAFTGGGSQVYSDPDAKTSFTLDVDSHTQSWHDLLGNVTASINGQTGVVLGVGTSLTGVLKTANNLSDVTAATARTNLGLGTAATVNTGTSGATIPLLNGTNTWGANSVTFGSSGDFTLSVPSSQGFKISNGQTAQLKMVSSVNDVYWQNTANGSLYFTGTNGGTAANNLIFYISGRARIGTAADDGVNKLQVDGGIKATTLNLGTSTLDNIITATATLDFAAADPSDLTITVTGAALGDAVTIGTQHGSVGSNNVFHAWVSAADTVTIRKTGSADPASGTFRAVVWKF